MSHLRSVVCMLVNILTGPSEQAFFRPSRVQVDLNRVQDDLNMRSLIIKYKGGKSISKGSHIMVGH